MAQLHRKQQLQGLLGPLYVRSLNGKTIVQTRSINPKQSQSTRASAADFKYAVAQSKAIRNALRPLLLAGTDPYASQRLTGELHKAFHFPHAVVEHETLFSADLSDLIGFEFHTGTKLGDYLPMALPFVITDSGTVKLEATHLPPLPGRSLPVKYTSSQLAVMVVGLHEEFRAKVDTEVFGFGLSTYLPAPIAIESQSFPTGTRVFIVAQLLLTNHTTVLGDPIYCNSKQFNPVRVLFTGVV